MNEAPRHDNQVRAMVDEIRRMEPEQRNHISRILFWVLLSYLQVQWAAKAALPFGIAALGLALVLWPVRHTAAGERRHLIVLHGAILVQLVIILFRTESWLVLADFAAVGMLLMLELKNRKVVLLFAIAAEHGAALLLDPWSALRFLADHSRPEAAMLAWARLFAIILVVAIAARTMARRPEAVPEPPPPKPARPMTAAEWDAAHRNR